MVKENKLQSCKICGLSIDIENEHHLILDENRGTKLVLKSHYHANCFREKFLVQQQMKQTLGSLGEIMKKSKEMLS